MHTLHPGACSLRTFLKFLLYFLGLWFACLSVYVPYECSTTRSPEEGTGVSRKELHAFLSYLSCVLDTTPRSSAREARTLNLWPSLPPRAFSQQFFLFSMPGWCSNLELCKPWENASFTAMNVQTNLNRVGWYYSIFFHKGNNII